MKALHKGFSLIEMMVVVAIIAILATIALPAYNGYINRSEIKAAQADLTALSLAFENRYQKMLSYPAATMTQAQLSTTFNSWAPASEKFTFTTTVATTSTYTLSAVGSGATATCRLTLNQGGVKTLVDTGGTCDYKAADGGWL